MTIASRLIPVLLAAGLACPAFADQTPSPAGAKAYFINLKDGDSVSSPVLVQFGLSGMGVAPAGLEGEATKDTGHHHLIVDSTLAGDALAEAIPMDDTHKHFGKGQTETSIELAPGEHTLQIVLADWSHVPHTPPVMSETIKITVK
jgi:Domain of unknown function (DUF4399)